MMRRVKVFEQRVAGNNLKKEDTGKMATFHCWSQNYDEFETGPGNYPVAVVEYDDGVVDVVEASMLQFEMPIVQELETALKRG